MASPLGKRSGQHDADQIDDILGRIQEKFRAGGVILDDKIITEIRERVLSRTNAKPARPTPAQAAHQSKAKLAAE
jgi:hypothetical protein